MVCFSNALNTPDTSANTRSRESKWRFDDQGLRRLLQEQTITRESDNRKHNLQKVWSRCQQVSTGLQFKFIPARSRTSVATFVEIENIPNALRVTDAQEIKQSEGVQRLWMNNPSSISRKSLKPSGLFKPIKRSLEKAAMLAAADPGEETREYIQSSIASIPIWVTKKQWDRKLGIGDYGWIRVRIVVSVDVFDVGGRLVKWGSGLDHVFGVAVGVGIDIRGDLSDIPEKLRV
ncbi:hypothetical protein Tco_1001921 [Tanacetum coccineum]|uniref:Uncharacterized protein n=1 Tax=Tanacetum coccineum TaxID=301880 RepID=A0ABQ5F5I9_9ASTR